MRVFRFYGVVQGVGFRPAVYKVAKSLGLVGYVRNLSSFVEVVVKGSKEDEFYDALLNSLPPLAKIKKVEIEDITEQEFNDFKILKSKTTQGVSFLQPDISVCKECLDDILNPKNRRYLYGLINCTNCGPRYTIIKSFPYDRKNTSMAFFKMCKECEKEYKNPLSRFYHAQPISCINCGPKIAFKDFTGFRAIKEAAAALKKGDILAIKGVGGYHLVCDGLNSKAVSRLRQIKKRAKKPFALMFKDISQIKEYAYITQEEEEFICSKERPVVVVKSKKRLEQIAPNIDRLGVFLPYNPIYYLLFLNLKDPLVVTSANLSGAPIIKDDYLVDSLDIDGKLWYDREIVRSCDDSVVRVADSKSVFYRLSRGYAPKGYFFDTDKNILAVGARQKNSIAVATNSQIVLSPYIADIESIESFDYFKRVVDDFQKIYKFVPDIVVADMHPKYETKEYAKSLGIKVVEVQHHKAHIYSALAELFLEYNKDIKDWIGFSFDGTGYGEDGNIWGGEVFLGEKRAYHFDYFKICGGERAIKDIRLQGWSLLKYAGFEVEDRLFNTAYEKGINCFKTSSVGRLFDSVAFIAGLLDRVEFDGEAGMLLEREYRGWEFGFYDFKIDSNIKIDFKALIKDKKELIPTRFINTLAKIVLEISKKEQKFVILSGGVFQNATFLNLVAKLLKKEGISYFFPTNTPINDGGISLGQLWWSLKNYFNTKVL